MRTPGGIYVKEQAHEAGAGQELTGAVCQAPGWPHPAVSPLVARASLPRKTKEPPAPQSSAWGLSSPGTWACPASRQMAPLTPPADTSGPGDINLSKHCNLV